MNEKKMFWLFLFVTVHAKSVATNNIFNAEAILMPVILFSVAVPVVSNFFWKFNRLTIVVGDADIQ